MSTIEQRARVFDSYFDEVQSVRGSIDEATDDIGAEYSDAARRVNAVTIQQLATIDKLQSVPDKDRFMARLALGDTMHTGGNVAMQREVLRRGLGVMDRVYGAFEDGSPVTAQVEKDGVTLYPSYGTDDLRTVDERHVIGARGGRARSLSVVYEKGVRVVADAMLDDMIHEDGNEVTERVISVLNGRGGSSGDNPFHHLDKWDPAHPEYNPPFVRLGTPDRPRDTRRLFVTDGQKFSLRAAAELMGHSDWLTAEVPSQAFRDKLIKEFAYAYWDLLAFGEPVDGQTKQIFHGTSGGKIGIEHRRNRRKSLVDYTTREEAAIHHGAGISFDQMVDATKEIVDRKESKADTKRKEYRVMRAKRYFNDFFFGANE